MNEYKLKMILTFMLLLSSPIVHSDAGWTNKGEIHEIQATTSGKLIIKGIINGNKSGCKDTKSYYLDYAIVGTDKIYSLLLQSIATNNQVRLFVTGRCEISGMSEISSASIYAK